MELQARVKARRQKATLLSSMPFHLDRHQTLPLTVSVALPASNNLIKKNPPRSVRRVVFYLIPDSVKLTTKISSPEGHTCVRADSALSLPCLRTLQPSGCSPGEPWDSPPLLQASWSTCFPLYDKCAVGLTSCVGNETHKSLSWDLTMPRL